MTDTLKKPFISNEAYAVIKWVAQYLLPGLATLVFALGGTWEWDNTTQIVGTITAFDLFLGGLLGLAKKRYDSIEGPEGKFDGTAKVINVDPEEGVYTINMQVSTRLDEVQKQGELVLRVEE